MIRRLVLFGGVALALIIGGWLAVSQLVPETGAPGRLEIDRASVQRAPDAGRVDSAESLRDPVQVTSISGRVERQAPGETWRPARVGDRLSRAESVRTGPDAAARLSVGTGSRLEVAGSSELSVREITEATHRFRLKEGRLSVDYRDDGKRVIQIEGRDGTAKVRARAGRFGVVATKRSLAVAARQGEVSISSAGKAVKVRAGERSVALSGQAPSDPLAIPKDVLLSIAGMGRRHRVKQPSVKLSGRTQPGNRLLVGDQAIAPDKRGRFSAKIVLAAGATRVRVVAESPEGKRREGELTYVYRPAPTGPRPKKPPPRGKITDINIRWGK